MRCVAWSPNGNMIASGDEQKTVHIWDAETRVTAHKLVGEKLGFMNAVVDLDFSSDGSVLAAGFGLHPHSAVEFDAQLIFWDPSTGERITEHRLHRNSITSLSFLPNSPFLATASHDRTARVIDSRYGNELLRVQHQSQVGRVSVSRDGKSLVTTDAGSTRITRIADGQLMNVIPSAFGAGAYFLADDEILCCVTGSVAFYRVQPTPKAGVNAMSPNPVRTLALEPGGSVVCSRSEGSLWVDLWKPSLSHIRSFPVESVSGYGQHAGFSPNGRLLAIGCNDKSVRIRDLENDTDYLSIPGQKLPTIPSFDSTGKLLVIGASASKSGEEVIEPLPLRVIDVTTGEEVCTCEGHSNSISSLASLRSTNELLSGSWDRTIRRWNLETGRGEVLLRLPTVVYRTAASAATSLIAVGFIETSFAVYHYPSLRLLWKFQASGNRGLGFSVDGKRIFALDDLRLHVFDALTGSELLQLDGPPTTPNYFAVGGDGVSVCTGYENGQTWVWRAAPVVASKVPSWPTGTVAQPAQQAVISTNAQLHAWIDADGKGHLWNQETQEEFDLGILNTKVNCLRLSADNKFLACGTQDGTVVVWDVATGQRIAKPIQNSAAVLSLDFSNDGTHLAWSDNVGVVRVQPVDATDAARIVTASKTIPVGVVRFLPGHDVIVTGDDNGVVTLWSLKDLRPIASRVVRAEWISDICVRPDGEEMAVGDHRQLIQWLNAKDLTVLGEITSAIRMPRLSYSPSGRWLVAGTQEGRTVQVQFVDCAANRTTPFSGYAGNAPLHQLHWSPDERELSVVYGEKMIAGWTTETWSRIAAKTLGPAPAAAASTTVASTTVAPIPAAPSAPRAAPATSNVTKRPWHQLNPLFEWQAALGEPVASDRPLLVSAFWQGRWDIFRMNADGSGVRNLTKDLALDKFPVWSPDGKQIAFASTKFSGSKFGLCVMDADGRNARQLLPPDLGDTPHSWTPDGRKIAITRKLNRNPNWTAALVDVETGKVEPLLSTETNSAFPSVCPTDGRIVLQGFGNANQSGSRLTHLDPKTNQLLSLSDLPTQNGWVAPTWSPDGKFVAYAGTVEDNTAIFVINADGTNARQLTHRAGFSGWPSWSPDGTRILFLYEPHNSNDRTNAPAELHVINVETGEDQRLASEAMFGLFGSRPSWQRH